MSQVEIETSISKKNSRTKMEAALAAELLEVLPKSMNSLRYHLRSNREPELTVPQFRVLIHLREGKKTNKFLAEKLGVSVPAMSRMVASLIDRNLITRSVCRLDRREMHIKLTTTGEDLVSKIRHRTIEKLSELVHDLPESDQILLSAACRILTQLFAFREPNSEMYPECSNLRLKGQ